MLKCVVIGANGQLGRDLCQVLPGEVMPCGRDHIDLTKADAMRAALTELRPDCVVNCAAYNFVDRAEDEPQAAFAVNAWGVRHLAEVCRDLNCTLVHFSTDYVFGLDRERNKPYGEDEAPGPLSQYGMSKLSGEYAVRATAHRHYVIRTCGLYGAWGAGGKGTNFVETMLRLAQRGEPLRIVNDQRCTPSFTVDVAKTVDELIQSQKKYGLFQITNAGDCTWYELANAIFEIEGLKVETVPITSAEFGAKAARPPYSVLSNAKLNQVGVKPPRPWREALAAYLEERKKRK